MRGRAPSESSSILRRGSVLLVVLALLWPFTVGAGAQTADEEFVVGSGRADARVLRFGPSSAQLGLTPSVSLALADFIGSLGRAESRPFDWAALDGSVPDEFHEHYSSVRVEARDESDVAEERSNWPFEQEAAAEDTPYGEATTRLLDVEIPGVLRMSGGRASAFAGIATEGGKRVREAGGTAVVQELDFFEGQGVLRGLRWELVQRTDASGAVTYDGSFVIGEGEFGGQTFEGPLGPDEAAPLVSAMNEAFAPLGLRIVPPSVDRGGGNSVAVSPLRVAIADSEVGNRVAGPLVEEFDRHLRPIFIDPFIEECEDCSAFVLIGDVTIGVLSGAGRFDVEFGGVFGTTEGERFENVFAGGFEAPRLGGPGETIEEIVEVAPSTSQATPGLSGEEGGDDDSLAMQAPVRDGASPARGGSDLASALNEAWAAGVVAAAAVLGFASAGYRRLRLRRLGLPVGG